MLNLHAINAYYYYYCTGKANCFVCIEIAGGEQGCLNLPLSVPFNPPAFRTFQSRFPPCI